MYKSFCSKILCTTPKFLLKWNKLKAYFAFNYLFIYNCENFALFCYPSPLSKFKTLFAKLYWL